ncbi:MAG: CHASE domain-containing protein [Deltaproteobacteria bacterium]|nr:CHASE domain-containing protein [Deltaproteobacteria bacterium]
MDRRQGQVQARWGLGPPLVLVLGLVLTAAVAGTLAHARSRVSAARFHALVQERRATLQLRLETLMRGVEDTAAFISSSDLVTHDEFETFAERVLVEERVLMALSWNVAERGEDGELRVRVHHIQPLNGNEAALGFDVASEARRREALLGAAATGQPTATAPVPLVQGPAPGLLVFAPVYRGGHVPKTPEARTERLVGFAVGVLSTRRVVEDALARFEHNPFELEVQDMAAPEDAVTFRPDGGEPMADRAQTVTLDWGGRRWRLTARPTETLTSGLGPEVSGVAGILISLLLAGYLRLQQLRRRSVEALASDLQRTNADLEHEMAERARAEEEQRRMQAKIAAGQKLESLGALSGGLAHDINNMLVGIIGSADYALSMLAPEPEVRTELEGILAAGQRVAGVTEAMLAYAGRGYYAPQLIELSALVASTVKDLRPLLPTNVVLTEELAPARIQGDVKLLGQALSAVLSNAVEALPPEGGHVFVRTGVAEEVTPPVVPPLAQQSLAPGAYAYVEVEDDGCGMAPETVERMFEPFFTTKFQGRGLGLAGAIGTIRRGQGTITVRSAPGAGTTLRLYLPVLEAMPTEAARMAAPPPPRPERERRVLVVDDEVEVRGVLRRILERSGVQVVEAADGRRCLELLRDGSPPIQVVLMDVSMDGLSGPATLAEMRRRGMQIPVVLMSGYAKEEVLAMVGAEQLQVFLHKPFRPDEVMARVEEAMVSPAGR